VFDTRRCTLTLVYLPHLDYDLQRFGPGDARIADALRRIDAVCGELVEHVVRQGARVIVLSEYGITGVSDAVHVNRELRRAGLLRVRCEQGLDKLDAGASEAFAVADHQVAHIYVHRPERVAEVAALVQGLDGVEAVLDAQGKRAVGLDHPRAGDLVAIARRDRWFSYYYWLDDARSPEFARTVDIHRKPGYDPVELFVDPGLVAPRLKLAWILLKKACGFRYLVDVIPLDATLVRGSHGRLPDRPGDKPLLISSEPELLPDGDVHATEVRDLVLDHVLAEPARPRIRAPAQPVPPGWIAT
jgi:predicted AlkP superfamily pyrophosphatase or phosphodiesterase